MKKTQPRDIAYHFSHLKDPRIDRTKRHDLLEIIIVALCGILCGANSWVEIEEIGKAKKAWLKQFLELPNGIPSHDTLGRVFALLDPRAFQECFLSWIQSISIATDGEIIAIDGKTLRRSFDRTRGRHPLHLLSAWACKNRIVLGQIKTADHSNEITAIPKLLQMLSLSGCIVTLDAIGCQKSIAQQIKKAHADYVLALKANQATLLEEVSRFLDDLATTQIPYQTTEKDHGRIEIRKYWLSDDINWFQDKTDWPGLAAFGMVCATRTLNGQTHTQRRYYLSSLPAAALKSFAHAVRAHWSIENSLHWTLDVTFREDLSRVRKDQAPQNFATLRRITVNLLKQEPSQRSINRKRLLAACDNDFLTKTLFKI